MSALESATNIEGPWWQYFFSTGEILVLHVDLGFRQDDVPEALEWLDDRDLLRFHRFQFPAPARRFALCRSALRAVLCRHLGIENSTLSFENTPLEKPLAILGAEAAPIDFSVSHSRNHGLIAVTESGRVGVDVEEKRPRRNLDGLVEMVMSPSEQAMFSGLEEQERQHLFLRFWTMKEALLKAIGTGLYTDISTVEVPEALRLGEAVSDFRFPDRQDIAWTLADIGNEDFAAALAYSAPA